MSNIVTHCFPGNDNNQSYDESTRLEIIIEDDTEDDEKDRNISSIKPKRNNTGSGVNRLDTTFYWKDYPTTTYKQFLTKSLEKSYKDIGSLYNKTVYVIFTYK